MFKYFILLRSQAMQATFTGYASCFLGLFNFSQSIISGCHIQFWFLTAKNEIRW